LSDYFFTQFNRILSASKDLGECYIETETECSPGTLLILIIFILSIVYLQVLKVEKVPILGLLDFSFQKQFVFCDSVHFHDFIKFSSIQPTSKSVPHLFPHGSCSLYRSLLKIFVSLPFHDHV
jgi:hypothetical protein